MKEPPLVFFGVAAADTFAVNPVAALVVGLSDEVVTCHEFAVEPARLDTLPRRTRDT